MNIFFLLTIIRDGTENLYIYLNNALYNILINFCYLRMISTAKKVEMATMSERVRYRGKTDKRILREQ